MKGTFKSWRDKFKFRTSKGLAKMKDLVDFAAWLSNRDGFTIEADDFTYVKETGSGLRLGLPKAAAASAPSPFTIDPTTGVIAPATVGGKMPTLGGIRLDALTAADGLDLTAHSGTFYVWFQCNYTVTWVESYLGSATLDSVTVGYGTSIPSSDADTKYIHFCTVTGGVPAAAFYSAALILVLKDNGVSATTLDVARS